jgi:3-keto-5-aminohexanoate cleavage enzyme
MDKMVITCAITGAETTREQQPNLPVTPEEIANATYEAYKAGASIVHVHARNNDGTPTQAPEVFREIIELIRQKCDIVIELTTGGAVGMTAEERVKVVALKPDMASLDCGTVNFGNDYIVNTLPDMRHFAREMEKYEVHPTLECFDLSHIYASHILIKEGLIKPPYHYGLVLNVPGGVKYEPDVVNFFLSKLPKDSYCTLMGIGRSCLPMHFGAIANNCFIRVGFEDNIYMDKGVLAKSNAELVERAVKISKDAGLQIATPQDVRNLFNLRKI